MEQNIKNVFEKISMEDSKMTEIREELEKKRTVPKWTKAVACLALGIATLLAIPSTRTMIVNAAERLIRSFHTADGGEVIYEEKDNELTFSISYPVDCSYMEISGDKIYLTVEDKKIDVTSYCGENSYYKYEVINSDGSKSVLLVGGSVERAGYVELVFDENGQYVFNKMQVPVINGGDVEPWVDTAMHAEGVPTGNWELDRELYE